ncbi:uncharacterized protein LOC141660908 [Apium graveolens]|uniref:uncharacterized protein LOC141660908 n=1 Tax=Apium graveolens TaxID=4045 RepID=UPI003D794111
MKEDAFKFIRACDRCQRFANYSNAPTMSITSLASPWSFVMWFGIPYKLISDNGKQFDSKEVRKLCENLDIKKDFAAVYNLQSNGQTEAINKIIKHTLKAKLEEKKGDWPEEMPMEDAEVNQRLHLDLMDEARINSQLKLAAYQQRIARHFNKKVKSVLYKVGDLVLQKVMPNTKIAQHGVLGANWEGPYKVKAILWKGAYRLEDLDGKLIPWAWNAEHLRKYYQ